MTLILITIKRILPVSTRHSNFPWLGWTSISAVMRRAISGRWSLMALSVQKAVMYIIRKEPTIMIWCIRRVSLRRIKIFPSRVPTGSLIIICQDVSIVTMDFSIAMSKRISSRPIICASREVISWLLGWRSAITLSFPIINTTIRLPIRKVLVWYGEISQTRDTRHRHCSTLMVRWLILPSIP